MNKPKLVVKHILNKECKTVDIKVLDPDVVVYSGVFITGDMERVRAALLDPLFKKYCDQVGKDMANNYVSINGKAISDFRIPKL